MAPEAPLITIVGCGPGAPEYVTPAAISAVSQAEMLVGARRLLDLFPEARGERVVVDVAVSEVIRRMETVVESRSVVVLVTGDPGLYSFASLVIKRFGRERCRVVPGISAVQVAFARLGLSWSDARIISAHKDDPDIDPTVLRAEKIAVLGGRQGSLPWIAQHLLGPDASERRVFVMENLTLETERIREVAADELASVEAEPRSIVVTVKADLLPPCAEGAVRE